MQYNKIKINAILSFAHAFGKIIGINALLLAQRQLYMICLHFLQYQSSLSAKWQYDDWKCMEVNAILLLPTHLIRYCFHRHLSISQTLSFWLYHPERSSYAPDQALAS